MESIIIFDGECNLCNGVVGWLLRFAPNDLFRFVAFQSVEGQHLLRKYGFPTEQLETVILVENNSIHTHSDGFLRIVSKIPKWRFVAALLAYIPRIIRDIIYNMASKNRVKWFGKSKSCTISFKQQMTS
ncbi:thiol-disulfide oxidoreductase DCC family protein [Spongiimicrobium salis]|uniref:thiol-disulfide oxidoreductase DCC family protein n=1 Tax=Spongiimicrobium salis TaxID=1667022 RepID=UPI00374D6354